MKPSARIQACIDVLEKTASSRVPMDATIGDYMRGRRYIGSKDRAAIVERAYAVTRHHARLGWILGQAGAPDTLRTRVIAYLAAFEGVDEKRLKDLFDGSKFAPAELHEEEKNLIIKLVPHPSSPRNESGARTPSPLREREGPAKREGEGICYSNAPESVKIECPPAYEKTLKNYFGADFKKEMEAMIPPAPLDLRVNTFLCSREDVMASLKKDGVDVMPTPYSPWGLRAKGKTFISKTKAFAKGWIDIQDEGSQLIAFVCGAKPGMQVLDYCAGGGGKTLALASAMERKGRIVAMDTEERRLEKGRERFRKAKVSDIIEIRPLSDERHRKWLRRQKETFDIVLVDAPCTGTGTWRRNPDTRWRVFGPGLAELVKTQGEILDKVAPCVKKGGKLVYATCSLLPDENENLIAAFLEKHPEFEIFPVSVILSDSEKSQRGSSFAPLFQNDREYMRLTPYRHGTDGFFAAVLRRKPAPG